MFDNIRKIILYLMCDAFVQIIAIIIAMVTWFTIPITAWQILWINLISDGFPSLALTVDPKRKWLMQEPPRDPKEKLITKWILALITLVSFSWAIVTFVLFMNVLADSWGDVELARSVAFASFGLTTIMYVYSVRSLKQPVRSESQLNNMWLVGWMAWGIALIVLPFIIPALGNFLDLVPIRDRWYAAIATGWIVVFIIEVFKAWLRENSSTD
jgi:Ca2+-transporting ATPase